LDPVWTLEHVWALGLLKAAVLFSALIIAAWRAWMSVFPFVCVLHGMQDMAAGIHEK